MKVQNLRGTRDFYPEKMAALGYLFAAWRRVCQKYGYIEFDGPILEPAALWRLKSGAEIPDQMYCFKDKGDQEIALRPELTPTLARMVAARQREMPKPLRWFSIPRCFRYEAPQKGRLREFFQLNVDFLGSNSMKADAEVILTAIDIMRELGCTEKDFYIRLGNRKLIQSMILATGVPKDKLQEVSRLIDKRDKLDDKDFAAAAKDLGVDAKKIIALIDSSLADVDPSTLDDDGKQGYEDLSQLMKQFEMYDVTQYITVDFSIMRGFDYYTSTVFEVFDRSKKYRAIAGGGRYDNLVADFGGQPCSGIGYGMGDVVLELFLTELKKIPDTTPSVDYFVVPVTEDVFDTAVEIATTLRKSATVQVDLAGKGLKKAFNFANATNVKNVVIVGPDELKENKVTIRDMKSGDEKQVTLDKLPQ